MALTGMSVFLQWGYGHMGGGDGWWVAMVIMMIVFWGGVLVIGAWGVSVLARSASGRRSALDLAKERYARGEITAEEFQRIKQDLA